MAVPADGGVMIVLTREDLHAIRLALQMAMCWRSLQGVSEARNDDLRALIAKIDVIAPNDEVPQ
jgi:hypothetical protein